MAGDELACFGVKACDCVQAFNLFLEHFLPVDGVIGDVVLNDCKFNLLVAEHVDVGDGCARRLRGCVHAALVEDVGNGSADWIVGAGRAAGRDVDECAFFAAATQAKERDADKQQQTTLHDEYLLRKFKCVTDFCVCKYIF